MTLKTDQTSIETLATQYSIEELHTMAEYFKRTNLLEIGEYHNDIETIQTAIQIATHSVFYLFDVNDEYGKYSEGTDGETMGLHQRFGDTLSDEMTWLNHGNSIKINQVIAYLKSKNVTEVYSGDIGDNFLGLSSEYMIDGYVVETSCVSADHIRIAQEHGISIKILKILV